MSLEAAYRALADPTRRMILRRLGDGEASVAEIGTGLSIRPATLSFHLNALKAAGLVHARRRGQQILYSRNTSVMQDVLSSLLDLAQPASEPETNP
jgi:DNA-binding transcriptional ArsR family regulator